MLVARILPVALFACAPGTEAPRLAGPVDAAEALETAEYLDVVTRSAEQVQAGTTIFGISRVDDAFPDGYTSIVEVAADGRVLWEYDLPAEIAEIGGLCDVEPTEGGTVLFVALGHGVYEVNRAGEIVWMHADEYASHDADRLPDGNTIYTRGLAPESEPLVVEVTPAGETAWSWDGLDAFAGAPYAGFEDEMGGWAHPNSVARRADGTTEVSLRNFNVVLSVAPSGTSQALVSFAAEASPRSVATDGILVGARPHDPVMLDERTMLVAVRLPHRVIEVDTLTAEVLWSWELPDAAEEQDGGFRDADRLPNGNTLVTGARRIYELAPDGEVVWEIVPPTLPGESNDTEQGRRRARVFNATRILPNGAAILD